MTIVYDIQIMQELLKACQTANDELQKAQNLVQEVTSHNDWTCKEKKTIDELMQSCKQTIKKLSEDQWSFLQAVTQIEGELKDAEGSVSGLFQGVESVLSKVLSIPVVTTVTPGTAWLDTIKNWDMESGRSGIPETEERAAVPSEEIAKAIMPILQMPISICRFSDLDL